MQTLSPALRNVLDDWPLWQLCQAQPRAEHIQTLPAGLTNQVYLLQLDTGRYVLRIASPSSAKLAIDRVAELQIQQDLAPVGLTAKVRYSAPDHSYWLRDYVEGVSLTHADLTLPTVLAMAQILQQVHRLPVPSPLPQLDIAEKADHYWRMIAHNYPADLLVLRPLLQQQLQGLPAGALSLCHIDPTPGNWIRTVAGTLVLLDWEYAALGHPWWDIAALLQQAQLTAAETAVVLQEYGIQPNQHWDLAQMQMRYMTVLWYGAQGYWAEAKLKQQLQQLVQR